MNILITGAGSGIAAGIAQELAKTGHWIVVTNPDGAAANAVAQDIPATAAKSMRWR